MLSEEDLAVVEQASATAAEVTGSMMRLKLELDEKKRTANILQTALVKQTRTHLHIISMVQYSLHIQPPMMLYMFMCNIQQMIYK